MRMAFVQRLSITVLICTAMIGSVASLRTVRASVSPTQISISNRIPAPFTADEKSIRKLNEILRDRGGEICPNTHTLYRARFSDNTLYQSDDLEPILKEENRPPQQIIYLSMKIETQRTCLPGPVSGELSPILSILYGDPSIEAALSILPYDEGLSYTVVGNNRDWVYLVQSDISLQLKGMGATYWLTKDVWRMIFTLFITVICCTVVAQALYKSYSRYLTTHHPAAVPKSFWGFILKTDPAVSWIMVTGMAAFLLTYMISGGIFNYLFPPGEFLIGDGIRRNEQVSNARQSAFMLLAGSIVIRVVYDLLKKALTIRRDGTVP